MPDGHRADAPPTDLPWTSLPAAPEQPDADASDSDDGGRRAQPTIAEALGGARGMVDSGLPTVVFVAVNAASGLRIATFAALAAGVGIFALRLARRQTVQQAISGMFGLALALFLARRTGRAEGFFLPGIAYNLVLAVVLLGSVLARVPLAGVVAAALQGTGPQWRAVPLLRRAYSVCTLGWATVFGLKTALSIALYAAGEPTLLAVARLVLGYPVLIAGAWLTVAYVRRAQHRAAATAPGPGPDAAEAG